MANHYIDVSFEERVALLTVNNPPVNVLSTPVIHEIENVLNELAGDKQAKVLVITGAGNRAFIAGADIKELVKMENGDVAIKRAESGQALMNKIERYRKPVIAAINGFCLGGGLELAMACHMRIAATNAQLGQPEINLGIIPGYGGTQRLPRIAGKAKALEMLLTGDMISAEEALQIGLVNRVVPAGEAANAAIELAHEISSKSREAIWLILESVDSGLKTSLIEGLGIEARDFGEAFETHDALEGMNAFIEKREPRFRDH